MVMMMMVVVMVMMRPDTPTLSRCCRGAVEEIHRRQRSMGTSQHRSRFFLRFRTMVMVTVVTA